MIFSNLNQLNQVLPNKGRLLGLDIGTKRIGLAISDSDQFIATPKLIINRQGDEKDFVKIKQFIDENPVIAIVMGYPINMDNSPIEMTQFVANFSQKFDEFFAKKMPLFLFEERLTSFEARSINNSGLWRKKSKFVDDIAASLILQHFLDHLGESRHQV